MKLISVRSPYFIIVNEASQVGSKVELFIWNKGTTEPTIPTYIMSENIASVTQTETNYNISPYILEYINQINPTFTSTPVVESNSNWCFVRVKRYKKDGNVDIHYRKPIAYKVKKEYVEFLLQEIKNNKTNSNF